MNLYLIASMLYTCIETRKAVFFLNQLGILVERSRAPKVNLKVQKEGPTMDRLVKLIKNKVEEVRMTGPDKKNSSVDHREDQMLDTVVDVDKISFLVSIFSRRQCS